MRLSLQIEKTVQYKGHIASVYCLTENKNTPYFYSAGGDGWIVQWRKDGSEQDGLLIANTETKIFSLLYDDESHLLLAGDIDGHLHWIDMASHKIVNRVAHHKGSVFGICKAGQAIFTVSGDGYLCKWDISSRQPLESIYISHQGLRSIAFNETSDILYIGSSDNAIYVIQKSSLSIINIIKNAHENSVFCFAFIDDLFLVSGGRDAHMVVRFLNTLEVAHNIGAHWFTINSIIFIREHKLIATASRDKTIRIWDADNFELLQSIDVQKGGHINSVNKLMWIPQFDTLISASDDRTLILWKINKV
ncbi:MAG: hypothetical protein IPO92_17750 [Saprospiraceae bacterium]|nr:hypothetical protein [Saprospiraceae bacterium]